MLINYKNEICFLRQFCGNSVLKNRYICPIFEKILWWIWSILGTKIPANYLIVNGFYCWVPGGTRTHDIQNHKLIPIDT